MKSFKLLFFILLFFFVHPQQLNAADKGVPGNLKPLICLAYLLQAVKNNPQIFNVITDIQEIALGTSSIDDKAKEILSEISNFKASVEALQGIHISAKKFEWHLKMQNIVALPAAILGSYLLGEIFKYYTAPSLLNKKTILPIKKGGSSKLAFEELKKKLALPLSTQQELEHIIKRIEAAKEHGANYENLIFYGEAGTGKTESIKLIAEHCGMQVVFFSGADLSYYMKTGEAAIQFDKVFTFAAKKPTIIVFDEADKVFTDIENESDKGRKDAMTKFLTETGSPSSSYSIIFSANNPKKFDKLVLSRFTSHTHFPLPDEDKKNEILNIHIKKRFGQNQFIYKRGEPRVSLPRGLFSLKESNSILFTQHDNPPTIEKRINYELLKNPARIKQLVSELPTNISGREIEQVVDTIYSETLIADNNTVDEHILAWAVKKHKNRITVAP